MNWKALLPAAAFLILCAPNAAFSRNHHFFGNQNGMNQFGSSNQFLGAATHAPFNSGINPMAGTPLGTPVSNVAPFATNAFAGNALGLMGNNSLLGMNNGMGMMCGRHRHHKHKRRNLLNALLNQNSMYGNNYGMSNNRYGGGGLLGNSSGYGGFGGYGGGMGGGLRNILNRI